MAKKVLQRLQLATILSLFVCIFSMQTAFSQAAGCGVDKVDCHGSCISINDICILEPIPGGPTTISSSETANLGALLKYLNGGLWTWALRIGVAIAVLQGAVAGLQIVTQGPDKVAEAKDRFKWAVIGLLMLLMAGAIMQFINPVAFSQ